MSGPGGSQSGAHDTVFRRILGEPANAASQLHAVLPPALVKRLDLTQLTRVSGSFVDTSLQWRHSDLLFTVPLDGHPALVYVLVEHQSSTDVWMPLRMLRYVMRIWEGYLRQHPQAVGLPVVIPLVVHHNRRRWSGPTNVADLLDVDPDLWQAAGELLPRFGFLLDDLAGVDEAALRTRPVSAPVRVMLLLLKTAAGNPRLGQQLRQWVDQLRAVLDRPGGVDDFTALLRYIELVGEVPTEQLHDLVAGLGPDAEEVYVTTAEMLRAEGEARGEVNGRARALVQLLTLKFGPLAPDTLQTVHTATSDQLETWTARVLTADTLAEILR